MSWTRPVPHPTAVSASHWEGCRRGELLYQSCATCGTAVFPPQPCCPSLHQDLRWTPSRGTGTVYSFTVVHRPQTPAFDAPYVVAIVELDEGFTMMTNLVDCDPDAVRVGLPVAVAFRRVDDGTTLPCFAPAAPEEER